MTSPVTGVTDAADAIAAVQARISSIGARFGVRPAGMAFADQLARTSGWQGIRQADGAPDWSSIQADGISGQDVLSVGQRFLGVPYQWGGTDSSGFDCSGLVQHVYRRLGVELPRVSGDQAKAGQPVASLADALPGDLVAFGAPVDHIGIYAGNGQMLVAPHTGDVVKFQTITDQPTAIRRVLRDPVPTTPTSDLLASLLADRTGVLGQLRTVVSQGIA